MEHPLTISKMIGSGSSSMTGSTSISVSAMDDLSSWGGISYDNSAVSLLLAGVAPLVDSSS